MEDVASYRTWWPWLRRFDASALAPGEVWVCEVRPPLPYVVTFSMTVEDVVAEALVVATLVGDIRGTARLTLRPVPGMGPDPGTELRLAADLAPASLLLRTVMVGAGPVARFGHDWVIDTGARQFAERAFRGPRPDVPDGGAEVLERKIIRGRMRTF